MNVFNFGVNEDNFREYLPDHCGVDWHTAYLLKNKREHNSVWGETTDDLGEFCEQLHQENCAVYLNGTNEIFDVIVVKDERDGVDWWWSREMLGDENFNHVVRTISQEVMLVYTKYPMQKVAEFVLNSLDVKIEHIDE